jgi:F-type H+-transporting ATPase subunit b
VWTGLICSPRSSASASCASSCIASPIDLSEKIAAELAQTEAQRRHVMTRANDQANTLIAEARLAAAAVRERETQKAVAAAQEIMVKAREASAREHDRMLAELKREVGRLVVRTTTAVTGKILTPDDHRRLAEETAKHVAA